jgi:hypothetical protein
MQLRGWGLSRAGRIVIILLVVQLLGLSPILAFAPPTAADPGLGGQPHGAGSFAAALPLVAVPDPALQAVRPLEADLDRATRPVSVPLPRRLPRAPPAA